MPRKPLVRTSQFPYHITMRCNNKEWFSLPLNEVWEHCLEAIKKANEKYEVRLISFVLMGNHYHMLIRTPDSNLDLFMYEMNKRLSYRLRCSTSRINRVFGARYNWCVIQSQKYLLTCYRYVYQNPLRAEIVDKCENYPYSSLNYIVQRRSFCIPISDCFGFKHKYNLRWLNQRPIEKEEDAIKRALKKTSLDSIRLDSRRLL